MPPAHRAPLYPLVLARLASDLPTVTTQPCLHPHLSPKPAPICLPSRRFAPRPFAQPRAILSSRLPVFAFHSFSLPRSEKTWKQQSEISVNNNNNNKASLCFVFVSASAVCSVAALFDCLQGLRACLRSVSCVYSACSSTRQDY